MSSSQTVKNIGETNTTRGERIRDICLTGSPKCILHSGDEGHIGINRSNPMAAIRPNRDTLSQNLVNCRRSDKQVRPSLRTAPVQHGPNRHFGYFSGALALNKISRASLIFAAR